MDTSLLIIIYVLGVVWVIGLGLLLNKRSS